MGILPAVETYRRLRTQSTPWEPAVRAIADRHRIGGGWKRADMGSNVVFLGERHVLKLFRPDAEQNAAIEAHALAVCANRLPVPNPEVVASGSLEGWPYLVSSRLPGTELSCRWTMMTDAHRLALASSTAELLAALHAVPVTMPRPLPDAWLPLRRPPSELLAKHQRDGVVPSWLDDIEEVLNQADAERSWTAPAVLVHGDIHPHHLLVNERGELCGLFDFGDVMTGPSEYDLAATACLMAMHVPQGVQSFYRAYGVKQGEECRRRLTLALLGQRYCALPFVTHLLPTSRRPASLRELLQMLHGLR